MDEINKLLDTDDDVIIELEFYEDVVVSSRENTRDYNGEHNIGNTNDRNDMAAADNQLDRESTNGKMKKILNFKPRMIFINFRPSLIFDFYL